MEEDSKKEKQEKKVAISTLYDINKTLVKQNEIKLNEAVLNSKKEIIKNFIYKTANNYYMLLCNERKDYTIFDFKLDKDNYNLDFPICINCANCLVDECLKNRGEIRGIDLTQNKDAIEIWMIINDEAYVYYFFPYDNGVVTDF